MYTYHFPHNQITAMSMMKIHQCSPVIHPSCCCAASLQSCPTPVSLEETIKLGKRIITQEGDFPEHTAIIELGI